MEAYGIPSDDNYTVVILNSLQTDVIADWAEAILDGNPDDETANEIWNALRG